MEWWNEVWNWTVNVHRAAKSCNWCTSQSRVNYTYYSLPQCRGFMSRSLMTYFYYSLVWYICLAASDIVVGYIWLAKLNVWLTSIHVWNWQLDPGLKTKCSPSHSHRPVWGLWSCNKQTVMCNTNSALFPLNSTQPWKALWGLWTLTRCLNLY